MALRAAHGEITPMPDGAIFADTMAEPRSVYVWLDWLEKQLPFPVHRCSAGFLTKAALKMKVTKDGRRFSTTDIPFYTLSAAGKAGKVVNRSCTRDYKIKPIHRTLKRLLGYRKGQRMPQEPIVTQWIGISVDEATRMKMSRDRWTVHRWPLIELGMNRHDCKVWMQKHGYPEPPRSSCIYCPFHSNAEWRRLRDEEPKEFAKAARFEKAVQARKCRMENFHSTPYLHRSCVPLDEIDFSTEEENGQINMFENECEGMCGV